MTDPKQQHVPIGSLHPQQLLMIKKQIEEEFLILTQSQNSLRLATNKFFETKRILKHLKEQSKKGDELLVPITTSLYVNGVVEDNEKVLIDFGTGYFVERNNVQAQAYCDRKLKFLDEHLIKIQKILQEKKIFIEQLNQEFQKKVNLMQQQHAQQQQQK